MLLCAFYPLYNYKKAYRCDLWIRSVVHVQKKKDPEKKLLEWVVEDVYKGYKQPAIEKDEKG